MSSKVVEADAGIHSLAMAVAVRVRCRHGLMYNALTFCSQPVISWRLYGMVTSLFCHCQRITGLTLSLSLSHHLSTLTQWGRGAWCRPSSDRFDLH